MAEPDVARAAAGDAATPEPKVAVDPTPAATSGGQPDLGARVEPPLVTLPKGGGAIRGLGEKFAVNPATGTASLSIPLPTSPGREGMQPQLSLTYDSGGGNSAFGIGWSLVVGSITRKTDKGVPHYIDSGPQADVYVLSGAEDLVPVLDPANAWAHPVFTRTLADGSRWHVERYRPRIERLFARIERWTPLAGGATHWRSISKDGVTSVYGRTPESRVADPADGIRAFSWLISETFDRKGNAMLFRYVGDDSVGVDLTQAHERNRSDAVRRTNRYLKRVHYGNATPRVADEDLTLRKDWLFELVLDYGDHDRAVPMPADHLPWTVRADPFSSYKSGFEVRTYRLCARALMFHHFPDEPGVGADCLVRSLDLAYEPDAVATKLTTMTQYGYRPERGGYTQRSFPPITLEYSRRRVQTDVLKVDAENLPQGIGGAYRLVDLDSEGLPGVLTEHAGSWSYRSNVGPLSAAPAAPEHWRAGFAPVATVVSRPSLADLSAGRQQLLDVQGDGRIELAQFDGPLAGFYSRTANGSWDAFVPFAATPIVNWQDPDLRFVDLTGDGLADLLITESGALRWHPSLGERGFGPESRTAPTADEERGPHVVFSDATQSIYLADLSGDGLADLVRVRNGEICYWPNLGYGRFGPKVAMDNPPLFDASPAFDQRRVRLADVDGSGPADLVYLKAGEIRIYANESGNRFADAEVIRGLPLASDPTAITVADLLGNGTSCLVLSSTLPADARSPLRYVDLMGGIKPHLLTSVANNLGAETSVRYLASTKFYVEDRAAGHPWITRVGFPVQLVARVQVDDRLSGNRFITRYAYHHGFFDGAEREFHGFALVEQWDTEEFSALTADGALPPTNVHLASHVPPVLTKTWFHTGAFLDGEGISRQLAGEYYREGDRSDGLAGLSDEQAAALELADTVLPMSILLPDGSREAYVLPADAVREACRALKGSILRQEIYGLDGTDAEDRPYRVSERNYTVEILQPRGANQHAVFAPRAREAVEFQYERALFTVAGQPVADPRVTHSFTLAADSYGNVVRSAAVGYGRRHDDPSAELAADDRARQRTRLMSYTELAYTNAVDDDDAYHIPELCESSTYELLKIVPARQAAGVTNLFAFDELAAEVDLAADGGHDVPCEDVDGAAATQPHPYRRLLRRARMIFRRDDLSAPLPLGVIEPLALRYEGYRLAFAGGLLDLAFTRPRRDGSPERLIPDAPAVLGSEGGYARSGALKAAGVFPARDADEEWWMPSGRSLLSPGRADDVAAECAFARQHFFLPGRFEDPFSNVATVVRDAYDLLILETTNPVGDRVTAGPRDAHDVAQNGNDYRVLEPAFVTDANGNRTALLFDARGYVCATARMGKLGEHLGDSLVGVLADIDDATLAAHLTEPLTAPDALLGSATTRVVYDPLAYARSRGDVHPLAVVAYALGRETHDSELVGESTRVTHRFVYTDGFGREAQRRSPAEPSANGTPRWTVTGLRVYDNKGKVVREYEPYFSPTHAFAPAAPVGVSRIRLYDAAERMVAVLHPDHSWEKILTDAWSSERWDVNDTVLVADPTADPDVGALMARLSPTEYLPPWYVARSGGALGQDEQLAAQRAAFHANTPARAQVDPLGREFVTTVRNRFRRGGGPVEETYSTRLRLDIVGQQRGLVDALGRLAQRSSFDLAGVRIVDESMDAGARWVLKDVAGKTIRTWDARGYALRTSYDPLRRPIEVWVTDPAGVQMLVNRVVYGDSVPDPKVMNLRGQVYRSFDGAGRVTTAPYDFKGNLLTTTRTLASEYRAVLDWSADVPLSDEFAVTTAFDAQDRPTLRTTPDGATVRPSYNEAGLLESVEATVRGADVPSTFVTNIDYNARGQRTLVEYGNGVRVSSSFDPLTFRLRRLVTTRTGYPPDCPDPRGEPCGIQNLSYTYDPVGNVTSVRDDAQPTIFFRGQVVEAHRDYVYDALYRVVVASGREHLGQTGAGDLMAVPTSPTDAPRVALPHPGDGTAMGRYSDSYQYDAVGNLLGLDHDTHDPVVPGWTRADSYAEANPLDPTTHSDRLSSVTISGSVQACSYDEQGNMLSLPGVPSLRWDHADRLSAASRQVVTNGGTPETTYYGYDANGVRIRKVTDRQTAAGGSPTPLKERVYLAGFETYREFDGAGGIALERETFQVGDDKGPVAAVETRTIGHDGSPAQLIRYQLSDPIASSLLELATDGAVISYEEYYAYGGTAYQAVRSQTEAPKRYRFAGKERDEESGLVLYGARYYAPWVGRWSSCDPEENTDGPNRYLFVRANPIRLSDQTGRQTCEAPSPAETASQSCDPTLHQSAVCQSVDPSQLVSARAQPDRTATSSTSSSFTLSSNGPATGDADADQSTQTNVGGAGYGLMYSTPTRFTMSVPDSYDFTKMEAYQRGVLRSEIGRNAGQGNSTSARRNAPAQQQARADHAVEDPMPTDPAPGGRGYAQDHIIELQHDLTGQSGTNPGDYRWQDSLLNSTEGSQSWALQRNNPLGEPAGAVVRASEAGRWYNSVEARGVGNAAGTALMVYGVYQSTDHVVTALQSDIDQGTGGEQTARAVAHEAGGWAGALAGAEAAAPWGAACGPLAWLCVPAAGLVGGGVGYWVGSSTADATIDAGQELTR